MSRLHGLHIVLTRPAGQVDALMSRIQAAGGEVLVLPLLAIAPPLNPVHGDGLQAQLAHADAVIFISPNAVRMALAVLPAPDWPPALRLVAIGQGTAHALHEAGFSRVLVPREGADSEAVLALPELQHLVGQRILLVRGEGGRELLATALSERGAIVQHAVMYRRVALPPDMTALHQRGALTFVITSSEALRILINAAREKDDAEWLRVQNFVFAHPRIAEQAKTFSLNRGIMAASPDDAAVFAALLRCAHPKETPHDGQHDAFTRS